MGLMGRLMEGERTGSGWTTLPLAAAELGVPENSLRRAIERGQQRKADGTIVSHFDGVFARKLGRVWRVRLDLHWTAPPPMVRQK